MVKELKIRVVEEIHERLKEVSEKTGKSINDIVNQLITAYLSGESISDNDLPVKIEKIKFRVKKSTRCPLCGEEIKEGTYAYYIIYTFSDGRKVKEIWHLDCYEMSSSEALAKEYLKIRKFRRILKVLKQKVEQYADELERYRSEWGYYSVSAELRKLIANIYSVFGNDSKYREMIELLEKLLHKMEKIERTQRYIIETQFSKKRPVRRKRSEEEEEIEI